MMSKEQTDSTPLDRVTDHLHTMSNDLTQPDKVATHPPIDTEDNIAHPTTAIASTLSHPTALAKGTSPSPVIIETSVEPSLLPSVQPPIQPSIQPREESDIVPTPTVLSREKGTLVVQPVADITDKKRKSINNNAIINTTVNSNNTTRADSNNDASCTESHPCTPLPSTSSYDVTPCCDIIPICNVEAVSSVPPDSQGQGQGSHDKPLPSTVDFVPISTASSAPNASKELLLSPSHLPALGNPLNTLPL